VIDVSPITWSPSRSTGIDAGAASAPAGQMRRQKVQLPTAIRPGTFSGNYQIAIRAEEIDDTRVRRSRRIDRCDGLTG
jgi:hypothetical protein